MKYVHLRRTTNSSLVSNSSFQSNENARHLIFRYEILKRVRFHQSRVHLTQVFTRQRTAIITENEYDSLNCYKISLRSPQNCQLSFQQQKIQMTA